MLQWQIGDVTISSVVEFEGPVPGVAVLPEATAEAVLDVDWLQPQFADAAGSVVMRIQALVVESRRRRIVVDTCLGNDKPRTNEFFNELHGPFLDDLTAAGFAPESIDAVVCTHLHVDHVGWNTVLRDGRWVPTFPEARYYLSRADVEYWSTTPSKDGDLFGDSVRPVIAAGLADLIDPPFAITDEVVIVPTPGHSPGHVSILIQSGGAEAVITGDVIHHPVQCARPAWASAFDEDVAHAEKTRREFLERYADTDVLVIGTHFGTPTAGHIVRDGDAYLFKA
jgi:glyoxylase-like metal-dependent hydrolase (beta-lactamase superfamily II)